MKHYISICADKEATKAKKIDLFEWSVLAALPKFAQKDKLDSMLVFNGYNENLSEYPRLESELNRFSSIFIDCDNQRSDPTIIEKFKDEMKNYDYMIYETASSTKERPKFRAIIPMDETLEWNHYAKKAIFKMFSNFADDKASWFFCPTLDKLGTICENTTGKWFPSSLIQQKISEIEYSDRMERDREMLETMKWRLRHPDGTNNPEGWRHLPSVKKCLEGLHVGERDNALCAACYAMDKKGYRSSIHQFLDECDVDREFKNKWKSRYR